MDGIGAPAWGRQRLVGAVGCSRLVVTSLDLSGWMLRTAASNWSGQWKVTRLNPARVLAASQRIKSNRLVLVIASHATSKPDDGYGHYAAARAEPANCRDGSGRNQAVVDCSRSTGWDLTNDC